MVMDSKVATQKFVKNIVDEAVDAIIAGMEKMTDGMKAEFEKINGRLEKTDKKLETIEGEVSLIGRSLKEKPSRPELEELEDRVTRLETLRS